MFGLGLATVGHFGLNDDTACGELPLSGGHSSTEIGTVTPPVSTTHCPLCHWQRAVSGATVASAGDVVSEPEPLDLLNAPASHPAGSTAPDERSSRGPPSSTL